MRLLLFPQGPVPSGQSDAVDLLIDAAENDDGGAVGGAGNGEPPAANVAAPQLFPLSVEEQLKVGLYYPLPSPAAW